MNYFLGWLFSWLKLFKKEEEQKTRKELPKSYYIGQEFIEDKEHLTVFIILNFHLSALIKPISFVYKECKVTTDQKACDFIISIERNISKKLFYSVSKNHTSERFIIGYINEILPVLNEHLINQKYLCGHLLIRTFSPLDIHEIVIINKENRDFTRLSFPFSITNFPRSEEFAEGSNFKFIRDLIESSTFYYYYNLDDCIRKIISSIENFFILRNITGKSFKEKLLKCLKKEHHIIVWEPYLKMFFSNIMYVYKIRNNIVHDKFRMDYNDSWLCKKGIGTLFYIYQTNLNDKNTLRYNFSLMKQFNALDHECMGFSLDEFNDMHKKSGGSVINSPSDMDKFVFGGLEISKEEIERIEIKLKSYNN